MTMIAPVYEPYEMRHVQTGVSFYRTTATPLEIKEANNRLRLASSSIQFFPLLPTPPSPDSAT